MHRNLTFHHLSDLHVGPLHSRPSVDLNHTERAVFSNHLDFYTRFLGESKKHIPDYVIISGDLTSYASEKEFNINKKFIRDVFDKLAKHHQDEETKPRVIITPGNHDLDWSEGQYSEKVARFASLSDDLEGKAISPVSTHENNRILVDGHKKLIIAPINSCRWGGIEDKDISEISDVFRQLNSYSNISDPSKLAEVESALKKLDNLSRLDPGYVDLSDLDFIRSKLPEDHNDYIKIGVIHHNLSHLPQRDVQKFDTILNAGIVKKNLMEMDFDLVLHGHKHQSNLSYEEIFGEDIGTFANLQTLPSNTLLRKYKQGLYILGANTMGSAIDNGARWYSISLENTCAINQPRPPSTLVHVSGAALASAKESYSFLPSNLYTFALDRPIYSSLRFLLERLGRHISDPLDRKHAQEAIQSVQLHLLKLQAEVEDWENPAWLGDFHNYLDSYRYIYATDILGPMSWLNPQFLGYLLKQFAMRAKSIGSLGAHMSSDSRSPLSLKFSKGVCDAIKKTGWAPKIPYFGKPEITTQNDNEQLEIVRFVIWKDEFEYEISILEMISKLHDFFAVPVFVLRYSEFSHADLETFKPLHETEVALGLEKGYKPHHCFQYEPSAASNETKSITPNKASSLARKIRALLEHEKLISLQQLIDQLKSNGSE